MARLILLPHARQSFKTAFDWTPDGNLTISILPAVSDVEATEAVANVTVTPSETEIQMRAIELEFGDRTNAFQTGSSLDNAFTGRLRKLLADSND